MTVDLIGPQGEGHFTHIAWKMVLSLALKYGWKPAGAIQPDDEDGSGDREVVGIPLEELEPHEVTGDMGEAIKKALGLPFPATRSRPPTFTTQVIGSRPRTRWRWPTL